MGKSSSYLYERAQKAILSFAPETRFSLQSADGWNYGFELPTEVRHYFRDFGPPNLHLDGPWDRFELWSFPEMCAMYECHAYSTGFFGSRSRNESWPEGWIPIASAGSDPFIFDSESKRVWYAWHDAPYEDAVELASSLPELAVTLAVLGHAYHRLGGDDPFRHSIGEEMYRFVEPLLEGLVHNLEDTLEWLVLTE